MVDGYSPGGDGQVACSGNALFLNFIDLEYSGLPFYLPLGHIAQRMCS